MRILLTATKIPWPPTDGGRLLLYNTLRAVAAAGHELTLVAPALGGDAAAAEEALRPWCRLRPVAATLRPLWVDAFAAQVQRRPWTVVRHRLAAMRWRVAELLRGESFDLIHAEQVQALGSITGLEAATPVVWRAQNVESDLWRATARQLSWRRPLLVLEARRLARWEREAVRRAAATVALTASDGERLAALSGAGEKIHRVAAPFAAELPAAERRLEGTPAVVLFGSGGWLPNRRGAGWFVERAWPRVREALEGAVLHVFGADLTAERPGIRVHPPPAESREAFSPGAILAVPLEIASGVRMKILEAWARGVPVVATPAAAGGLGAEPGRELAVADSAGNFARAIGELAGSPPLAAARTAAGRALLRREHAFDRVAARLTEVYAVAREDLAAAERK